MTHTPDLPYYQDIITRLKTGDSILDIGCCFGQDLRYMAADGAPTQNMFASDIIPVFWDIGYDLYRDAVSMKARFLEADILDLASLHQQLETKMDILLVNQVFHLFSWDTQVRAGKNMVALSRPGTWIVGFHIGSTTPGARRVRTVTGGVAGAAGGTTKYYHCPDTWQAMWQYIGKETNTKWVVESSLHEFSKWGLEAEDSAWMGPTARGLEFIARRSDSPQSKM